MTSSDACSLAAVVVRSIRFPSRSTDGGAKRIRAWAPPYPFAERIRQSNCRRVDLRWRPERVRTEERAMMLTNRNAVIYGAGGAVGGAVARAFAREGARVFLTGRNLGPVEKVATSIAAEGGARRSGTVGRSRRRGSGEPRQRVGEEGREHRHLLQRHRDSPGGDSGDTARRVAVETFMAPVTLYMRSHFLTARAAARHMVERRSGVILMHTPEPARLGTPLVGGMGPAWAAMEAFNRNLSAEFAAQGIRTICLRSTGLPEPRLRCRPWPARQDDGDPTGAVPDLRRGYDPPEAVEHARGGRDRGGFPRLR